LCVPPPPPERAGWAPWQEDFLPEEAVPRLPPPRDRPKRRRGRPKRSRGCGLGGCDGGGDGAHEAVVLGKGGLLHHRWPVVPRRRG
jgi:hypothetical protein